MDVFVRKGFVVLALLSVAVACNQEHPIGIGKVLQLDPELETILPADAKLERLADGFGLLEGPAWSPTGELLFSDMHRHLIYQWSPHGHLSVYPTQLAYAKTDDQPQGPSGPNGLAFDKEGRLTVCEHGNRRVTRVEKDGTLTVLAERYEGKRLNSPNDLVYRADGRLYFTDPPSGLPGDDADPHKELSYSGVYLFYQGRLRLVSAELRHPNGLAFSPDEQFLYVGNSGKEAIVIRYAVNTDGTLSKGEMFVSSLSVGKAEGFDGMKVDVSGNLYLASSAGLVIVSPAGKHLGTIQGPEEPLNVAWGDQDGRTLYVTAFTGLYRLRLKIPGNRHIWLN